MWNLDNSVAGGFVNDATQSPSSRGKKEQFRRAQSVVPLVTCQINNCTDEDFTLFGMPVQIADLVGILRNFEIQSTKASCVINDHTGEIKAVLWLETENDAITAIPPVKEGHVVRIFGSIRNQDGEKFIMILKMLPVDDCNVITHHLLQVIHARLSAERLMQNKTLNLETSAARTAINPTNFSDVSELNWNENELGLKPVQLEIVRMLKLATSTEGMERSEIMKRFPPGKAKEVNEALRFLLDEGHAYTTINDDHFKATDGL